MKRIMILFLTLCLIGCQGKRISKDNLYYLISLENNIALLAPEGYEIELHDKYADEIIELSLADEVEYYDISIYTVIDEKGNEDRKETKTKISINEIHKAIEYYSAYVYIECDDSLITKMTLYGELIVYE